MADIDFNINVRENGTIFSAAGSHRVMAGMTDKIEKDVAREGYNDVQRALGEVLRHPTGYYQSRVTVHAHGGDMEVDGDNVIYGPWLEGVGERNRTTRFRGYFTFRRVAQALEAKAGSIADKIANREARRFN
jgi:hypothetical protein